ncbi:S8 family peptidase [Anabaena azotica]|uniref:S8 family serine peptidase n=1 Tax=Anabaena azotica FACHB-119 TaxID=947527 RepID=A0ABR8D9W0_9NOST|nr:S8 family peptidase [Anabaena azotica]MBD2503712.1 S8 family serine peptidase [Anabaena azotica FACHB-119]
MPTNQTNQNSLENDGRNSSYLSSSDTFNTENNYTSNLGNHSSYTSNEATATSTYNSSDGYGLIDANKSVSEAAGTSPSSDVADQGGNNWGLDMINAPEAWNQGYTGQGVIVAVIDTGVDYNHQDLKNNMWTNTKEIAGNGIDDDGNGYVDDVNGWNFNDNNNNTLDDNGHGTHVSGIIAGENDGDGVTGVAYNSQIMSVKVLDASGSGSYDAIASGIRYAVDNGAKVVNLSLGGDYSNQTLQSAIEYADSKGVVVVMASGNDGRSKPGYPARYADKTGIAVGAVDENGKLTDFSNRSGNNQMAYVTAPGDNIYSSTPDNQYEYKSGTSMATPYVSGVVALMLSANPNLTVAEIRDIITSNANNSNSSTTPDTTYPDFGFGFFTIGDSSTLSVNNSSTKTSSYSLKSFSENNNFNNNSRILSKTSNSSTTTSPNIEFVHRNYLDSQPNSLANTPTDSNDDFGELINQIIKQLEEYQKLLGR